MRPPLRVGVVGLGRMGRVRLSTVSDHPDTIAVVGYDPNSRATDIEELRIVDSLGAVFESDIDAVFVCTPNRVTPEIVSAALDAGKHVFAEKPPGRTMTDIEEIMKAEARNPELVLKFGFNHRYHHGIRDARDIVDSQRYGRLIWVRGVYGKGVRLSHGVDWRDDPESVGGGILLDQGIHMLDLIRYFLGDFVEIKSMCVTSSTNSPLEDNAFALLRTRDGGIGTLHSSFTQWKHLFRLELGFTNGYLTVDGMPSSTRSYRDERITHAPYRAGTSSTVGNPPEETRFFNTDRSWELELAEFVDCVDRRRPPVHGTSADAYEAMRAVHAIYEGDASFAAQLSTFRSSE